jgi:hypothetical protein
MDQFASGEAIKRAVVRQTAVRPVDICRFLRLGGLSCGTRV